MAMLQKRRCKPMPETPSTAAPSTPSTARPSTVAETDAKVLEDLQAQERELQQLLLLQELETEQAMLESLLLEAEKLNAAKAEKPSPTPAENLSKPCPGPSAGSEPAAPAITPKPMEIETVPTHAASQPTLNLPFGAPDYISVSIMQDLANMYGYMHKYILLQTLTYQLRIRQHGHGPNGCGADELPDSRTIASRGHPGCGDGSGY